MLVRGSDSRVLWGAAVAVGFGVLAAACSLLLDIDRLPAPGPDAGTDGGDGGPGCTNDPSCDDGNPCNGIERCLMGRCVPGTPPSCDDGIACTHDGCASSGCTHVPMDVDCAPGEYCDTALGCVAPCLQNLDCNDGIGCTMDQCVMSPTAV